MSDKTIKIEFTEPLNLEVKLDINNQYPYKRDLLDKIKGILNTIDVDDFFVYETGEDQIIELKINNSKSPK